VPVPNGKKPSLNQKTPLLLVQSGRSGRGGFRVFLREAQLWVETASCDPKLRLKADVSMHFVDAM
jgi:hypothetical protein